MRSCRDRPCQKGSIRFILSPTSIASNSACVKQRKLSEQHRMECGFSWQTTHAGLCSGHGAAASTTIKAQKQCITRCIVYGSCTTTHALCRWTIRSAFLFVKSGETFDERAAQTFTIQHRARGCVKLRGALVTLEGPHGLGSAVTVDRVFLGAGMSHCRGVLVATITQRGDSALFVSTVVSMQLQRVYLWRHCQIVEALLLIVRLNLYRS